MAKKQKKPAKDDLAVSQYMGDKDETGMDYNGSTKKKSSKRG